MITEKVGPTYKVFFSNDELKILKDRMADAMIQSSPHGLIGLLTAHEYAECLALGFKEEGIGP